MLLTDAAINTAPDLALDIGQNAGDVVHVMANATPRVALLSAVETVTPKLRSTLGARVPIILTSRACGTNAAAVLRRGGADCQPWFADAGATRRIVITFATRANPSMAGHFVELSGKRGLVIGIANEQSIATGCAAVFKAAGVRLAATYLNDDAACRITGTIIPIDGGAHLMA